ncbi:MAG: four helix bundle protein, partial [Bacteroidales bacterium]|nr:four helix bundle protein [Bacteroidales bacterium]
MRNDKENVIVEKSFQFALEIVLYCELLEENKKYVLSRQLLRAGTSIGANVREAQNAESKADFIHKIKLAVKEADETEYWLLICKHTPT